MLRTLTRVMSYVASCCPCLPCCTAQRLRQTSSVSVSWLTMAAEVWPMRGLNQGVKNTRLKRSNWPRSRRFLHARRACLQRTASGSATVRGALACVSVLAPSWQATYRASLIEHFQERACSEGVRSGGQGEMRTGLDEGAPKVLGALERIKLRKPIGHLYTMIAVRHVVQLQRLHEHCTRQPLASLPARVLHAKPAVTALSVITKEQRHSTSAAEAMDWEAVHLELQRECFLLCKGWARPQAETLCVRTAGRVLA